MYLDPKQVRWSVCFHSIWVSHYTICILIVLENCEKRTKQAAQENTQCQTAKVLSVQKKVLISFTYFTQKIQIRCFKKETVTYPWPYPQREKKKSTYLCLSKIAAILTDFIHAVTLFPPRWFLLCSPVPPASLPCQVVVATLCHWLVFHARQWDQQHNS